MTRSVFDRYDIVDEADLAEGVAKLATYLAGVKTSQDRDNPGTISSSKALGVTA